MIFVESFVKYVYIVISLWIKNDFLIFFDFIKKYVYLFYFGVECNK